MFLVIGLQALYGFSIPLSKILLNYAAPFFASSSRMLFSGIAMLGVERVYHKKALRPIFNNTQLHIYTLTLYAKYMMRAWYVQELTCVRMAFLFNLGPFIAALLSYLFLSEKLSKRQWLGMSIGCSASIWPLYYAHMGSFVQDISISFADMALVLAMVINFYGLIIKKKLLTQQRMSVTSVNGTAAVGSGGLGLITSYYTEGFFPVQHIGYFAGWLTLLLLLSNIICRNLYASLLKKYSVTFLSLADFLMNICTALYGTLLFNETITSAYILSSIAVCIGLYLFYVDEQRTCHCPKTSS